MTAEASNQVPALRHAGTGYDVTYSYTYDGNGNILSVSDGTNTTTYEYDSANQLLRENNQAGGYTHVWTYDNAGNILSRTEYAYTTGALGTPTDTDNYTYGDSRWGDLLTAYDGQPLTHDTVGNLTNDGTWTYTWEHGRELASMTDGTTTWSYSYNANGMRTYRTNGSTGYSYVYNGSELDCMYIQQGNDETRVNFTHAPDGTPMGFVIGTTTYYYVTNLQGDVVALLSPSGNKVVEYTYDAWGNILSITGSLANSIGKLNPLRYRGYVYDNETGLYYLQSRYYDPELGRFISADGFTSTGQGFIGNNMFAYCGNDPFNYIDPCGCCFYGANGAWCHDNWEYLGGYERKPDPGYYQGTTPGGLDVYVATDDNYTILADAVKVVDKRDINTQYGLPDPDFQIIDSYKYTNRADQVGIFTLIYKYIAFNPSVNTWKRSESGLYIEWDLHNLLYMGFKMVKFKHADFDNNDEHMLINSLKRFFQSLW